jgi:hypothetical protein
VAYFPNGTEGRDYQERYCVRCIHDTNNDCPIWLAHLIHNGDKGKLGDMLDLLIPRSADGLTNEKCRMFAEWDEDRRDRIAGLLEQAKEHVPPIAVYGIDRRAIEEALK